MQRVTCGLDAAEKLDLAAAVSRLIDYTRAGDAGIARRYLNAALNLLDPDSPAFSPRQLINLCRWGVFSGNAAAVVDTACQEAVVKADQARNNRGGTAGDADLAAAYDGTFLALARLGKIEDADEALAYAAEVGSPLPNRALRTKVMNRLKNGESPAVVFPPLLNIFMKESIFGPP